MILPQPPFLYDPSSMTNDQSPFPNYQLPTSNDEPPMTNPHPLTYLIASVWLINGLFCKVLNLVPRHEEIIATILGADHSRLFALLIGWAEIGMAVWILKGWSPRVNAITQIVVIATMNILEFMLVPELLLWGKANIIFAFIFILIIYYNEFHLNRKLT